MADIIQLLPDNIANQIAAGEVVQRPASVIKELLENSIDAGSTSIKIMLKDAGKTLIQVVDDGKGMSQMDARMCFERHATSKISSSEDLFKIKTMGFRGEAMASIAAVAQVEMKSKRTEDEVGTQLKIAGSTFVSQEPCTCNTGTYIAVKNLFFNVPARRNFLSSDATEMRHILDEFTRVSMANPEIQFVLYHNQNELYHLVKGNLRQRIVSLLGKQVNEKIIPIEQDTESVKFNGFVSKTTHYKKTRGEQYFFVNNRFIKSNYFHHAVMGAFEGVIPKDTYPLYVIFIEVDPSTIDVNVHPTKQEIKFEDERLIYNYLKVAIKHAIGIHHVAPSFDFEEKPSILRMTQTAKPTSQNRSYTIPREVTDRQRNNTQGWDELYKGDSNSGKDDQSSITIESSWTTNDDELELESKQTFSSVEPYQIHQSYIVSAIKSGYILIHQQYASERILFDQYINSFQTKDTAIQKALFPVQINLNVSDAETFRTILPQVQSLGFEIEDFGNSDFVIQGMPANLEDVSGQEVVEKLIAQYKSNVKMDLNVEERIALSLAKSTSIKKGKKLNSTEMLALINQLFACPVPHQTEDGRTCFVTYELNQIEKLFN